MFTLRKRESSNGPFIGGELPISTQILNKNSWIAETTRCQGARVPTLARLRAASAPPASPRLLTAAGAPRPASSCLRPPLREARSTFRRKRVRTLGGSVGLCCHGPLTFEGQRGVTGNTTWTVSVRKPRACCQTQRQIPPCEHASRRPVASDQWPPCWPLVSCLSCTQHVTHLYGRVPSPFPTTSARPDRGLFLSGDCHTGLS